MKRFFLVTLSCMMFASLPAQKNIGQLKKWLSDSQKGNIEVQAFAVKNISKAEAAEAATLIYESVKQEIKTQWTPEWNDRKMTVGGYLMPFEYKIFGDQPDDGRSLYISMHGGGGAPATMNDQQWKNQMRLYTPAEGVYLTPRSAVNEWNMWFLPHVDSLFDKIIQTSVIELNVNPDKVYVMGYSAGGDGVYRLAPRMADRWAAASMMAGHSGGVSPVNVLNTPYMLWMGANDAAYDRNKGAAEYGQWLDSLQKADPQGYIHKTHIVEGKGHWMDRADTLAITWMAQYTRNPYPLKVVWRQDDTPHDSFYWLSVPITEAQNEKTAIVERSGNQFTVVRNDFQTLAIGLNDEMIDFSRPVKIIAGGKVIFDKKISRNILSIYRSVEKRKDPKLIFSAYLTIAGNERIEN